MCVVVCCSVLQCVTVCCSVLQCVAISVQNGVTTQQVCMYLVVYCSMLQRVEACYDEYGVCKMA